MICSLAQSGVATDLVVTPNIAFLGEMERDPEFATVCAASALSLPDGWPISRLAGLRGCPGQVRVTGSDLVPEVCAAAASRGLTVGFVGGQPGAAEGVARLMGERHPELRVVIASCPPMGFELSRTETARLLADIAGAAPSILFLAVGTPKSELFAHRNPLSASVVISVGAALDFMHGSKRRAPAAFRALGLEWAFRAVTEPRRLLPRYARATVDLAKILLSEGLRGQRRTTGTAETGQKPR